MNEGLVTLVESDRDRVRIKFVAHACVLISVGDQSIILDPWLTGIANHDVFHTYPSAEAFTDEEIASVRAIHISHIHDDHFCKRSLSLFPKSVPIFVGNYSNKAFFNIVKEQGHPTFELSVNDGLFKVGPFEIAVLPTVPQDAAFNSSLVLKVKEKLFLFSNDSVNSDVFYFMLTKIYGRFSGVFSGYAVINPLNWLYDFSQCKTFSQPFDGDEFLKFRQGMSWNHIQRICEILQPDWVAPYANSIRFLNEDLFYLNAKFEDAEQLKSIALPEKTVPAILDPSDQIMVDLSSFEIVRAPIRHPQNVPIERMLPPRFHGDIPDTPEWRAKVANYVFAGLTALSRSWTDPMVIQVRAKSANLVTFDCRFKFDGKTWSLSESSDQETPGMRVTYAASALASAEKQGLSFGSLHLMYAFQAEVLKLNFSQLRLWA